MTVIVVIEARSIGQAVARRVSSGKHVLLADLRLEAAEAALANDELKDPAGRVIGTSSKRQQRVGQPPDEVGTVGALLMGPVGAFITGSDFLMDGGVTAAYWYGELAAK